MTNEQQSVERQADEWVVYLHELAAVQAKEQVRVNIKQAADFLERLADRCHGAEVGAAILRERLAAGTPGEAYRVFCEKHDEHKARYMSGRPMLNDQCPKCVIESLRASVG